MNMKKPLPVVSITDATVLKPTGVPKGYATLFVTLGYASDQKVKVEWSTKDSGDATAPEDYLSQKGVISFNPGQLREQIVIAVVGKGGGADLHKAFYVELKKPVGAIIPTGGGEGTVTILSQEIY